MATIIGGAFGLLTQLALAKDGAILGVALACGSIYSCHRHNFFSSALKKISNAESVSISDLPALVAEPSSNDGKLVVVRGLVQTKSSIEANWQSSKPDVLVSCHSGAKSVSLSMVPFVLVDNESFSEYVTVNMDRLTHPLPLTTVYRHLELIPAPPSTFFQALLFRSYPIGLLEEDKLLPLGKEISAVGTYISYNGNPQIKSCEDLPCFLSVLTKDQMLVDLSHRTNVLFWAGIVLGTVSAGILGYALTKSWQRWKAWIEERRTQQLLNDPAESGSNEDGDDLQQLINDPADSGSNEDSHDLLLHPILFPPDSDSDEEGQMCVTCRVRRRRRLFVPCRHFLCCYDCSLSLQMTPHCPLCGEDIIYSITVYNS